MPVSVTFDINRPKITFSVGTNFWESVAHAPHERSERFLETISYLYPEFPVEGTDVTGSFLRPKDPEFTVVVLKVSLEIQASMFNMEWPLLLLAFLTRSPKPG